MLTIRLFRVGRTNQPLFKIVVADKRNSAKAGRFVEEVGFYNPVKKGKKLNQERIKHWLSVGAKPSETVYNMFVSEKIIEGKKIPAHKKSKKPFDAAQGKAASAPAGAAASQAASVVPAQAPVPVSEKPAEVPAPEKTAEEKPVA